MLADVPIITLPLLIDTLYTQKYKDVIKGLFF